MQERFAEDELRLADSRGCKWDQADSHLRCPCSRSKWILPRSGILPEVSQVDRDISLILSFSEITLMSSRANLLKMPFSVTKVRPCLTHGIMMGISIISLTFDRNFRTSCQEGGFRTQRLGRLGQEQTIPLCELKLGLGEGLVRKGTMALRITCCFAKISLLSVSKFICGNGL